MLQVRQLGGLVPRADAVFSDPAAPPHLLLPPLPARLHLQWASALPASLTLTRMDQPCLPGYSLAEDDSLGVDLLSGGGSRHLPM